MKSKATIILTVAILFFAAIYIGIYIGRMTASNTVYVPDIPNQTATLPKEDEEDALVVELNTATVNDLDQIPGISYSLASEIIAYRKEYGNYVDVEELLEVEGMTEALYEQIRQYVTVDDSLRRNPKES